jgi:hypothetical protein
MGVTRGVFHTSLAGVPPDATVPSNTKNILNGRQIYAFKCLGSLDLDELVDDLIAVLGSAVEVLRGGFIWTRIIVGSRRKNMGETTSYINLRCCDVDD